MQDGICLSKTVTASKTRLHSSAMTEVRRRVQAITGVCVITSAFNGMCSCVVMLFKNFMLSETCRHFTCMTCTSFKFF